MGLGPTTLGLYSPTDGTQGPLAQDTLMAGVWDIMQAPRPMSDLDSLVSDWRNSVGDKMRRSGLSCWAGCPDGQAHAAVLPSGADWLQITMDLRTAFIEHPVLDPSVAGG